MHFVETPIFTRAIGSLLDDEAYRVLQTALVLRPEQGALMRGTGGLRKLRWGQKGKGKRGGCRVIYYWDEGNETFYMLFAYPKRRQEDLTPAQIKILSKLVREEFK